MGLYRITFISDETRGGGGKPNIIELGFADDADAITFGTNLDIGGGGVLDATFVSADLELSSNYGLPYPAGTEFSGRVAFGNAAGARMNVPWSNALPGFIPVTRVAALIAAGFEMVLPDGSNGGAPAYGNAQIFELQQSI